MVVPPIASTRTSGSSIDTVPPVVVPPAPVPMWSAVSTMALITFGCCPMER